MSEFAERIAKAMAKVDGMENGEFKYLMPHAQAAIEVMRGAGRSDVWDIKPHVVAALKGAYVGAALRQPLEEGDCHFIIGWLENAGLKIVPIQKD